ncbi:hypothetical protein HYW21_04440 [Candidatus Woesearchaeota archaeon]|nr:hypothetical protein [Candidatus Woesearchaeota archaeon]
MAQVVVSPSYDPAQFAYDQAKAGSREFMYQFLCKQFPKARDKLRALYLSGPTPIEAEQVYLRAGFQPTSLFAIDHNPNILHAAEATAREKGLPINHSCSTEIDFLRYPPKELGSHPLDVVSLDYLSTYGPMVVKMLDELFDVEAQHLGDHAVLFINTQARRENPQYQGRLALLNTFVPGLAQNDARTLAYVMGSKSLHQKLDQHEKDAQALTLTGIRALELILQGASPKAGSRLGEARLGLFADVYVHTQFPLLRRVSFSDITHAVTQLDEEDPSLDSIEVIRGLESLETFATRFPALIYHQEETYRDAVKLAIASSVGPFEMYAGIGVEKYGAKTREDAFRAGFLANRMHAWLITAYDVYTYISMSSTPMMLHAFALQRRLTEPQRERTQAYGLDSLLAIGRWHDQLCTSDAEQFKTLRTALHDAGIDPEDLSGLESYPGLEHFRAGQRLREIGNSKHYRRFRDQDLGALFIDSQGVDHVREQYWERVVVATQQVAERTEKMDKNILREVSGKKATGSDRDNHRPAFLVDGQIRMLHQQGYSIADLFDLFTDKLPGWTEEDLGDFMGGPTVADKDTMRLAYVAGLSTREIYDLFHPRFPALSLKEIGSVCAWARIYDDRKLQETLRMAAIAGLEPKQIHEMFQPAFPRLSLERVEAMYRWTKVLEGRRE